MAKVIPIGQPVNDAEREAIRVLRDGLPDSFELLHNFELHIRNEVFEVDIALLAPHAVYLVDVKGTRGHIDVYGQEWHPAGRQPFASPLLKLRSHARALKGLIVESDRSRRDLGKLYVDAVVLLSAPDAGLSDPAGRDAPDVVTLDGCVRFFQDVSRLSGRDTRAQPLYAAVRKAITGVARAKEGPKRYGDWVVDERLGGTEDYTEYRAHNAFAGGGPVRLRAYRVDPYLPDAERKAAWSRIANAYKALEGLPSHPAVPGVKTFFPTEAEDELVLVTEDVRGEPLRARLEKASRALTLDQKLQIAKDVLGGLAHAHLHGVAHRNLTPANILVRLDGRARLTNFDFARAGAPRTSTVLGELTRAADEAYLAPEWWDDPARLGSASDVFSAGLIFYEMFTGERPFRDAAELFDHTAMFALKPSEHDGLLPEGLDAWLQGLCAFRPDERPSAKEASAALEAVLTPLAEANPAPSEPETGHADLDYTDLPPQHELTRRYVVEERLGKPGSFGVVYKVIDTLADRSKVVKLITRDRHSTTARLKKEYKTLLGLPDHPRVVKVLDADFLPQGEVPFVVFEYVDGLDVGELIDAKVLTAGEALELGRQSAEGLVHLHRHGVYHCDVKPRNLLWTDEGARLLDFNVSVMAAEGVRNGGGTRAYLPPDLDVNVAPTEAELADRDVYALALTVYQVLTGRYPWDAKLPPPGRPATDPRRLSASQDVSPEFADVLLKALSPKRGERFDSAEAFLEALQNVKRARRVVREPETGTSTWSLARLTGDEPIRPNTNPFVSHLLTLYSQSRYSNSGTRGLDAIGDLTYVPTALDDELLPAVLEGDYRLVVITGNAGDGKTAFLQKLEASAGKLGADVARRPNGGAFDLGGRAFLSNYDGSQDEGERGNDEVLGDFFAPFADEAWGESGAETRLIAINEGRLVDFLSSFEGRFSRLREVVGRGLSTGVPEDGVAVVNLNLRSVVAAGASGAPSIFERQLQRLADERFWSPCERCDLKSRCYAFHNARTLQDAVSGPKVAERLKTLYTLVHLRGRLHVTLRDLRSALAFTIVGTRDCDAIHELYAGGDWAQVMNGFYFNSWMGGEAGSEDRLLSELRDVDVARADDARLDRMLDFLGPGEGVALQPFERRGTYDQDMLSKQHADLPRPGDLTYEERLKAHQRYVAFMRRRAYFERRDEGWWQMLPYKSASDMLSLIVGEGALTEVRDTLIRAVNRGEGLADPDRLQGRLAIKVRHVENGSIQSYRVFPSERFRLEVRNEAARAPFVEHMPIGLTLTYRDRHGEHALSAELPINLDVFEMLRRLNEGYLPTIEETQGYYLSLAVFKNVLASAPYQEVLLTEAGYDFYRIERLAGGILRMEQLTTGQQQG